MTTKITIKNNGPFLVEGEFELVDGAGSSIDLKGKQTIALCRCGATENSPFCDGAHKRCGFQSEILASEVK